MTTVYYTRFPVHVALTRSDIVKRSNQWNQNDPQFRHRAVMGLFDSIDSDHPRSNGNILFRLDRIPGVPPYFLVQSTIAPTIVSNLHGVEVKQIELGLPNTGQPVRFRLAVNAVRRTSDKRVNPVPIYDDPSTGLDGFPTWLDKKMSGALDQIEILNHTREVLTSKKNSTNRKGMSLQIDLVDAVASVNDPNMLHNMVIQGVGRAKSFGCGLLSVHRLA